jgi:hypothetical protein
MSAERHSLGGSSQDDPRSVRSIDSTEESRRPSKSSCASPARPFILARLIPAGPEASLATPAERSRDSLALPFIPAGPSTALGMPPTFPRRAV